MSYQLCRTVTSYCWKLLFIFFAEAEANQAQGGKLHTTGPISYPTGVRVFLVVLKLKNDFYKILAGVRHCCRFEALFIIVTSRCNFSLKIVNLKYTLKLTKSWSEQPFLN